MIETARRLSRETGAYWTDQSNNHDAIAGYYPLGEEIWAQTNGEVDAFVHCVGMAASSRGVATVLKRHKPGVRVVVVEPGESSVLLGGQPSPHNIEGIGIGYTVLVLLHDRVRRLPVSAERPVDGLEQTITECEAWVFRHAGRSVFRPVR